MKREKIYLGLIAVTLSIMPIILEAQMNDPHTTSSEATAFNNGRHIIARQILDDDDPFNMLDEQVYESQYGSRYRIMHTSREVSPSHTPNPWAIPEIIYDYARHPSIAHPFGMLGHLYPYGVAFIQQNSPYGVVIIIPDRSVTYWIGFTTIWTEGNSSPYTDSSYCLMQTYHVDPLGGTSFTSLTGEPASDFPVAYYGNELIYYLPYLRPQKYYWLRALLYYEQDPLGLPPILSQTFKFDSVMDTTVTLKAGVLDTLNLILSPECYQDYETVMRIIGSDSMPAFLAGLILYEFNAIDTADSYQYSFKGISQSLKHRKSVSLQVYPNLFSHITTIKYQLPRKTRVNLKVYDTQGRVVKTLIETFQNSGSHQVTWDGRDEERGKMPDGIYFLHLTTDKGSLVKKVMLVR